MLNQTLTLEDILQAIPKHPAWVTAQQLKARLGVKDTRSITNKLDKYAGHEVIQQKQYNQLHFSRR